MRLIDADELQKQINELEFRYRSMLWSSGEMYEECLCAVLNMIANAPTIAPPPNDPLTLEQLREMDGEPVWIVSKTLAEWNIIHSCHPNDVVGGGVIMTRRTAEKRTYKYDDYGKTWMAYRRKPEEGET